MHQISGRVWLGFSLALVTAVLWGALPLALKWLLQDLTAATVTWARFLVAALLVGALLQMQGQLHFRVSKKGLGLLAVACVGLLLNYIFYLVGLSYLTAESAQMLIQLAPFLMMIGAVFLFKERLLFWQKVGAWVLLAGLVLFFNERLSSLFTQVSGQTMGVLLVGVAAMTWAAYALAQKQLLRELKSQQIMWLIYVCGAIVFLPASEFSGFSELSSLQWGLLLFCCLNTVVAYGAFAEALQHWQASNVSAVLAITPLFTIAFAQMASHIWPVLEAESLNSLALLGAIFVVTGSVLTALSGQLSSKQRQS